MRRRRPSVSSISEMSGPAGTPLSSSAPIEILVDVVLRVEVGTSTGYVASLVTDGRC